MCGIAGIVSKHPTPVGTIQRMADVIHHRGPDAHSVYQNDSLRVSLGHRRLSIIDLSPEANQPFHSTCGRFVIVFNGEIYNYQQLRQKLIAAGRTFRTSSDTEVVVEAFATWGAAMVPQLDGMFAIAIFDKAENCVFLTRDRVGKKPLYYFKSDTVFAFASELKSLLEHPLVQKSREVNQQAIAPFLHLGFIPEPNTIFKNLYKFPAAHYGLIDETLVLKTEKYWGLEGEISKEVRGGTIDYKKHLNELLVNSVKKRLIADVPVGAFLSGGTDSSLVCAVASRLVKSPIKTFSIGFEEKHFDELPYAAQVAGRLSTDHSDFVLTERDAMEMVNQYLTHFDEPFADTSAIPTMLVSKLARKEVTVALTGDGGDELFLGYGAYQWADRLSGLFWKSVRLPANYFLKHSGKSRLQRISHLFEDVPSSQLRSHIFSQEQYFFSQREIHTLLLQKNSEAFFYTDKVLPNTEITPAERQAIFDFHTYLKDDLLVKVDRASMLYGLECRCPLLDRDIITFAVNLNKDLKVKNGQMKWLLKELLRDYLPENLINREKRGFSIPLSKWLKNDLRFLIDQYLCDQAIDQVGLLNKPYVEKLKHHFFRGKDYLYNRLWVMIVLQKWIMENQ